MPSYIPSLSEPARRWIRFGSLLIALVLLCWIAFVLRGVFTPLLVAAALAYVLNPLVTWLERQRRIPRLAVVIVAFALLALVVLVGGLYAGSRTLAQLAELQARIPHYVQVAGKFIAGLQAEAQTQPAATAPATAAATGRDWWAWAAPLLQEHGIRIARVVLDQASAAAANVANWLSFLVLVPVFTFYFLWRFNEGIALIRDHLPAAYRENVIRAVRTIDGAMATFFRGRCIVCLVVGLLMALGWTLVGVPYSLALGLLAGVLNLVPFMSLLALPPALVFAFLAANDAGTPWLWPVVLTMAVYMAVQAIESFVLSPAIEGQASGLHPLVIVVALLIGSQLGGLLGMLLAIPVASTLRTFAAEWVLPEVRRLAHGPPALAPDPAAAAPAKPEPDARG